MVQLLNLVKLLNLKPSRPQTEPLAVCLAMLCVSVGRGFNSAMLFFDSVSDDSDLNTDEFPFKAS